MRKNRKKRKDLNDLSNDNIKSLVVEVSNRNRIELHREDLVNLSEAEVEQISIKVRKELNNIRETYYAVNTPILEVRKRTFRDLVKRYFLLKKINHYGNLTRELIGQELAVLKKT